MVEPLGALEHVAVAGHQQAPAAGLPLLLGEGAEQVVGLERLAGRRSVQPKAPKKSAESSHCGPQLVGEGRLAVGVVGREQLEPVGGGVGPEAEHDGPRLVRLDLAQDQVGGAEQRVDRLAVRPLDRLRQGVERPEEHRGGIDGEQRAWHAPDASEGRRVALAQRGAAPTVGAGSGRLRVPTIRCVRRSAHRAAPQLTIRIVAAA